MEDLVLEYGGNDLIVEHFDEDNELHINADSGMFGVHFYLTPSQTRELIAHLTNCLKEVENG